MRQASDLSISHDWKTLQSYFSELSRSQDAALLGRDGTNNELPRMKGVKNTIGMTALNGIGVDQLLKALEAEVLHLAGTADSEGFLITR